MKKTFGRFKKTEIIDEILKISTQFVHQICENVPQKIQENFSPIGFSSKIEGIESKLSVFRSIQVSADNTVQENQVVGSQWFGVHIKQACEVKQNKFMAMQLTEFSVSASDLCESQFSLSRMSHVTLQETCFVQNKFSVSTWSDASITESDFTGNTLNRCNFSGIVVHASRLSKLEFSKVNFKDCEFENCEIQGIQFENCEFKDCSFSQIQAVASTPVKISGCKFVGKQFSQCSSLDEFMEMLHV
ncbi:MAG: pentapeptide repeat-containing protein [Bdellovibrionota bacterium]